MIPTSDDLDQGFGDANAAVTEFLLSGLRPAFIRDTFSGKVDNGIVSGVRAKLLQITDCLDPSAA